MIFIAAFSTHTENTPGKTKEKGVSVIKMQDSWILARLDKAIWCFLMGRLDYWQWLSYPA